MNNETLATIGASLGKIGTRISERLGDEDGTAPHQVFDECLTREIISLRDNGQENVATLIATIRSPIDRYLRGGW